MYGDYGYSNDKEYDNPEKEREKERHEKEIKEKKDLFKVSAFGVICLIISIIQYGIGDTIRGLIVFFIPLIFIGCIVGMILEKISDTLCTWSLAIGIPILFLLLMNTPLSNPNFGDGWKCYNKTSIDYNWKNDMKCVDKYGNEVRTDYEGAKRLTR